MTICNGQLGKPMRNGETRSEEHTSELQSRLHLVCRLLLEKKNKSQHSPPEHQPLCPAPRFLPAQTHGALIAMPCTVRMGSLSRRLRRCRHTTVTLPGATPH